MNVEQVELKDLIRVEGIVSKGYGMLPYFVMQSSFLSVNAKCVYAYFCSYTGGGEYRLFPGISKILSDLQMSKNRYYEAYNQLQAYGLLSVEQKKKNQHFDHNEYTLNVLPVCVLAYKEKYKGDPMETRISTEGIHAWGYGNIPKAVMLDDRLDAKEKSLYAYFCSLAGFRYSVQPDRDRTIRELGISHNTYNKYMFRLQELNYITVSRTRSENGRGFGSNVILLNVKPDEDQATLNSSRGSVTFVQPNFEETKNKETKTEEFGGDTKVSVQPNFKEAKNEETKNVEAKNEETNNIDNNTLSYTYTRDPREDSGCGIRLHNNVLYTDSHDSQTIPVNDTGTQGNVSYTGKCDSNSTPVNDISTQSNVSYTGKCDSNSTPVNDVGTQSNVSYTGKCDSNSTPVNNTGIQSNVSYTGKSDLQTPPVNDTGIQNNVSYTDKCDPQTLSGSNRCLSNDLLHTNMPVIQKDCKDIPTLSEVRSFIETAGYAEVIDYREFFRYYEDLDWCDGNGKPVINWHAKVRSWVSHNYKPVKEKKTSPVVSKTKTNGFRNFEERKTDYDSLLQNYELEKTRGGREDV